MQASLTPSSLFALFTALVVLAAVPGVSALTVVARAATYGLTHGVLTALGIVAGDMVFIAIALGGLALMAEVLSPLTVLLQYIAGVYLIGLGVGLYRSQATPGQTLEAADSSWLSSFLLGLSITLGDQKATLFYLGFLPAFVDIATLSWLDAAMLMVTTFIAVGGVKVAYALLAARARSRLQQGIQPRLRRGITAIASVTMVAVGIVLLITA